MSNINLEKKGSTLTEEDRRKGGEPSHVGKGTSGDRSSSQQKHTTTKK